MAKKFANILGLSNAFGYNSETNTYLPYLLLDSVKNDVNTNTICFVEADENDEGFNIKGYDIKAGDTFIITQKGVFGFFPKDGITPSDPENPGQVITSWRPIFINDENIAEIEIEYEDFESGDTITKEIGNEYKLNLLNSDYLSISYTYDNENNIVGCKYELDISKLNSLYEFTEYLPGNENVSIADIDNYKKEIIVNGYKWDSDNNSFAEGTDSVAKGYNSHAEGDNSNDGFAEEYDTIIIYDFNESQIGTIKNAIGTEVLYYTLSELRFANIEIYPFQDATTPVGRITFLKYYDGYQHGDIPACYCLNLEFYDGYTWEGFNYDENLGDNAKRFKYKYISGSYGDYSHSEGDNCVAYGVGSYASGCVTYSQGLYSHTEGNMTNASGDYSHAEGNYAISVGDGSHSEGNLTLASGDYSHAEGTKTLAIGFNSHAEGESTKTIGDSSHAEGISCISTGLGAHSEGSGSHASGEASHAEGLRCIVNGIASHAEGGDTHASGDYSHAEGGATLASGIGSHTEGYSTIAEGEDSHAEGSFSRASGEASHAEGYCTIANNTAEHAEGMYNFSNSGEEGGPEAKTISSIGIGTDDSDRKNAFEVMQNGDVYINGIGDYDGKNAVFSEDSPISYSLQYVVNNLGDNLQDLSNTVSGLDSKIDNEINNLNTNLSNRIDTIENASTYTAGDNIDIQNNIISALGYAYNPSYIPGIQNNEYYDKLFCIKAKGKVDVEENVQFSNSDFTWEYISPFGDGDEEVENTILNYIGSDYEDLTQIVKIGDTLTFNYYNENTDEDISIQATIIEVYPTTIIVEGNHYNINPSNTWITIGVKYPKDANNIVVNDDGVYVKGLGDFNGVSLSDVKSLQTIILELQSTIQDLTNRITALESATTSNE